MVTFFASLICCISLLAAIALIWKGIQASAIFEQAVILRLLSLSILTFMLVLLNEGQMGLIDDILSFSKFGQ